MLSLANIDAVVILTPIHLNSTVTIAALLAGRHVFVEKPTATSLEEIEQIIQLEAEAGKKVFVLEQLRYDDQLTTLKGVLDEGRIGRVVSYELANHGKIDDGENSAGGYGHTTWRINPEFPLGPLFDGGVHTITRLTYLFSRPASVYALGTQIRAGFGEYDHILMTFAHPRGVHGTVSFADYLDGDNNYFLIRGTKGTISVSPTQLSISGEQPDVVELPASDRSLNMWQHVSAWFSDRQAPIFEASDSVDDIATLVAVDESLRARTQVDLA
jgi:predicted dehydrogenase